MAKGKTLNVVIKKKKQKVDISDLLPEVTYRTATFRDLGHEAGNLTAWYLKPGGSRNAEVEVEGRRVTGVLVQHRYEGDRYDPTGTRTVYAVHDSELGEMVAAEWMPEGDARNPLFIKVGAVEPLPDEVRKFHRRFLKRARKLGSI